jgi:hypothetical protein
MATLNIVGLTCVRTTAEARDEPYFTATYGDYVDPDRPAWSAVTVRDLGTIWGPTEMNDGDSLPVGWSQDFTAFIDIELHEHDRVGSDEHIETFRYRVGEPYPERYRKFPNVGEVKYNLTGHRANYEMIYDLRDMGDMPGTDRERCRLILVSLRCNDAQEIKDEPYLVVNGERVWSATKVKTGQTRDMGEYEVAFGSYAQIDLWESDGARSDRLGEFTVDFEDFELGRESGNLQHVFRADRGIVGDATYTLTYRVRRLA